jgi:hypothetical protein
MNSQSQAISRQLSIDPITLEVIRHGIIIIGDRYSFRFALS